MSDSTAHSSIGNTAILASAGCGKTYKLVSRMLALGAMGSDPERILALTFTKAAAGEIFDELVKRLADAALSDSKRQEANNALATFGIAPLPRERYAAQLHALLSRMHLVPAGTLDGFFARVVRAFPLELGTMPDFQLVEGHAEDMHRERILRRLLAAPADDQAAAAQQAFRDAFRRATMGREGKTVFRLLQEFVAERHQLFLAVPDGEAWGNPSRMWPPGASPCDRILTDEELDRALAALARDLEPLYATDAQKTLWADFFAVCRDPAPATRIARLPTSAVFWKLHAELPGLQLGQAVITADRRKMNLGPGTCSAVVELLAHLYGLLIRLKLENTRGGWEIMQRYEEEYERTVRGAGMLTFADLALLLTRAGTPELSRNAAGDGDRLYVDYRLDGQFEHWALDEFQDTSRSQWAAIENLVDEVMQDNGQSRTFFMVGDVKQAIYGWRGGDSRLMREICERYDLPREPLDVSRRSCPDVLELVNRIFAGVCENPELPAPVRRDWASLWHPHTAADSLRQQSGWATVLEAPDTDSIPDTLVAILNRIRPWERGLKAAVLVRSNTRGIAMTESLRAAGIPVVWEADKTVSGHPAVAAMLSNLRRAAHPADTLSGRHVGMCPAAGLLAGTGGSPEEILASVFQAGFAGTIGGWVRAMETAGMPVRGPEVNALLGAAAAFDNAGRRDLNAFVEYVESFTAADAPPEGKVRVLTIHRSKGLGFDIVLVPFLESGAGLLTPDTQEVLCGVDDDNAVQWILDGPGYAGATDPVLQAALQKQVERTCTETLCVMYVALTRAKRGLYVVGAPAGNTATALRMFDLVRTATRGGAPWDAGVPGATCLFGAGNPTWWDEITPAVRPVRAPLAGTDSWLAAWDGARRRHRRRVPSEHQAPAAPGGAGGLGREFGSLVHQLFAEVEWYAPGAADAAVAAWRMRGAPGRLADEAEAHFRRAMASTAVAAALTCPAAGAVVWREQPFECILNGEWVSGVFDRVQLSNGPGGRVDRVEVLDFKSDAVPAAGIDALVAFYRPQLDLYVQVLKQAFPAVPVTGRLVFTACGEVN